MLKKFRSERKSKNYLTLCNSPKARHRQDSIAGTHDASDADESENVSMTSTYNTPYDLTSPATQNWTKKAPKTMSQP